METEHIDAAGGVRGGCLCGQVRYAIDGLLAHARLCHCSNCRKHGGSAFAAWGYVESARFRFTAGAELVRSHASSPQVRRTFCGQCGSTLQFLVPDAPEAFGIALGTVDGDPGCRPGSHVFAHAKAPWFQITDDLFRHSGVPED